MPTPVTSSARSSSLEHHIYVVRGLKVMLDRDLAALYGVKPIALRQQVRRNSERFPEDFMFQLTADEADSLVSQSVIPSRRSLGGSLPFVFAQEGVAMLSSVLRSRRAVLTNIVIMRTFARLREMIAANKDLAARVEKLEHGQRRIGSVIEILVGEIEQIKALPEPSTRKIGFDL
jgi:ORF6N domain